MASLSHSAAPGSSPRSLRARSSVRCVGEESEQAGSPERGTGRAARRHHVPGVRRRSARSGARAPQLADRALRGPEPDGRSHAARRDRADRHPRETPTVAFVGWFGPRGLASIVFAVIVAEDAHLPGEQTILLTTYLTVGLSVLAHGLSAAPLAAGTRAGSRPTRRPRWSAPPATITRSACHDISPPGQG